MHKKKTTITSAVALCLAAAAALAAQAPVTKTQSVTGTATIQAIETSTRAITLRDETGAEETYVAGPEVKRFDELKVGDTVRMTYYESVFLEVRKPGAAPTGTTGDKPSGTAIDGAITRAEGALPGVSASVQEKMTVVVKSVDPALPSLTVTTPDGRTITRKVDDKKNLEGLAAGDKIDITYTRALLTSIERK